jgi:hypothetical protein
VEASLAIPIFKGESRRIRNDGVEVWSRDLAGRARHRHDGVEFEYLLRVALPEYVSRPPAVQGGRLAVGGVERELVLVEDVAGLAEDGWSDASGGILVRTIARALTKYLLKEVAEENVGKAAGLLVNLVGAATESADVRSWRSLPYEIRLAVIRVPPGTHEGRLVLSGPGNRGLGEARFPGIELAPGGIAFLRHRAGP